MAYPDYQGFLFYEQLHFCCYNEYFLPFDGLLASEMVL